MRLSIILLITVFCSTVSAEEAKLYCGLLYGDNIITPYGGVASKLIGGPSDMAKLESERKKERSVPIFVKFTGYKREFPRAATYQYVYQIQQLILYQKFGSNHENDDCIKSIREGNT